ncbi:hypothetical protein MSG28_002687 [Choristoneura fumiferana]|uniref:Uncharacterized protein n=1 Tax=Choristoneura fumiferana TaxID=7141 RepID=A0ACC0JJP5_CHOFU|nr:hypothetical protein MSG28_002687 [Choristoneura fumiferana]
MDVPDEGVLDVDLLVDDGSEDEGEAPPSSDFYAGPASTPTSCASSPRGEEPASPHGGTQPAFFHHQPYARPFFTSGRRGPGRPRKEGAKLAREGKIVRRYRGGAGSVRGAKRHRGSRDDALDDIMDEDDFTMPAPEEPPFMPEKWPGKSCALCNLTERSQLGQGEMRQFLCNIGEGDGSTTPTVSNSGGATPTNIPTPTSTPTTPVPPGLASPPPELVDPNQHPLALPLSRRQKAFNKCKTPLYNMEHTDELSIIGHVETIELPAVVSSGAFYIHRCCLEFSPPFHDQVAAASSDEDKEQMEEARIKGIVTVALTRKCAFCLRHGASIPCKMSCSKYFHLPCILASGGFMDFQTKSSFCKDHLYQVPLICAADIECRTCRTIGDISNLMTCVTCGAHYHGTCVGLAQLPGVRAGWSCRSCRVCQVCRGECAAGAAPADSRHVTCEHCDKTYHATCLRPMMATVPKYGWKCKCCRICSDCGARSPGAGPSSRWHAHYTVCDSCYQQRNKGSCCPLCRRAYRAAAYRDMIRCTACKRYVHGMCDPEAEPQQYRLKKEQSPTYEYNCPICKTHMQIAGSKPASFEDDNAASTSQDSSFGEDSLQQEQDPLAIETKPDVGLGKGKPYTVSSKVAKKKIGGYKFKGGMHPAKLGFQKRQRSVLDFGRKRGTKPKMRGVFGVPGLGLQRPQAPDNKTPEDDPGVENKLVLCSSKDKFVLTQDLCVMCGAVGTDSEGCLIACAQCGQTYHPYCVNIKVSQVIVTLGWRCLDCTVCEGCGNRGDEALLVLCDDCDTAWHTYCARPPLGDVPRGAWRCERCRKCLTCGTRDTHTWCENYTECGPCASLVMCCVCTEPYSDGELIIQCEGCRRWLHATCDSIRSEADAETCCRAGYNCLLCRGREHAPPHLAKAAIEAPPPPRPTQMPTPQSLGLGGEYYVDDVCLSQRGAHHMKQLEAEMGITHTRRKRRFKNETTEKDAVVQNADVEMPDDSKPDSTAEVKEEPGISNANLKEGILWNVVNEGPPPEGFTVYTTESGLTVLRRKRQRNLNKLGIGGFVVRQRQTTKTQADDEKDGDGTQASGESPGNKRKPRRKPRSKLMEQFPSYMQEAFFGKELLEPAKPAVSSTGNPSASPGGTARPGTPEGYRELRDFKIDLENSDSDGEDVLAALTTFKDNDSSYVINLNSEEIGCLQSLKSKEEKDDASNHTKIKTEPEDGVLKHTEDSTALKNAILGPQPPEEQPAAADAIPTVHSTKTEAISSETGGSSQASTISPKDDLSLLGVNLDAMVRDSLPDMDSNDVDEIFKGVLTDDSQESQESSVSYVNSMSGTPYSQQRQQLQSPMEYASPYHNDFGGGSSSNSALSPLFSDCGGAAWGGDQPSAPPPSYNQRSAEKMRADESLGPAATISAVLYANTNHPEWKTEFPNWVDRCKQILKKWRALPSEQKAPYLQRARDNRSAIRMKKAQQSTSAAEPEAGAEAPAAAPAAERREPVRAPNVTVTARGLVEADAHIRVLTPSEIMRTLPRLATPVTPAAPAAPATPSVTTTEQERACGQQRSAREAEQERQWKQLQQLRQQQTQHQQQIIHDQRVQAAMQRLRTPEAEAPPPSPAPAPEAPRSAFPAQRFPLHYANNEDINRQLRDLLQRHPEKMWPGQAASEEGVQQGPEGQPFRHPLPVTVRPRAPLPPGQRPDHQPQSEQKQEPGDHGNDEMDMGDMDKLEQDTGNIGESLKAEIGEQFNILEFDDPELAALDDAEHILDGLELDMPPERHVKREHPEEEQKPNNKIDSELRKSVKNIESTQCKPEDDKTTPQHNVNQQMALQVNAALAAGRAIAPGTRLVGADGSNRCFWRSSWSRRSVSRSATASGARRARARRAAAAAAAVAAPPPAPAPPSIPLYAGAPPPAPPPPDADPLNRHVYETWLKQYNAFAADQLRYYEGEVQKLRKIRKSLNSKQRQLRKSGNELQPNDAAELRRVSAEQQALQKHLEAARKHHWAQFSALQLFLYTNELRETDIEERERDYSLFYIEMIVFQEYETKHRQQNPQLAQQTVINQQQITTNQTVYTQNQNIPQSPQIQQTTINRPMQIGLQGSVQQQQIIRNQQTVLSSDGQQRIGLVTSPLSAQGRILQSGRTLVIEQTGSPQQQLVRQLSGVQERPQSVGMVQFGQQQLGVRSAMPPGSQTPRPAGARPAMSPLHVQSPHSQSPLHSLAPQSPLHHLTSPMQSPLHSQQSPLHHTSQSPLHPSTQSPLHTQQSPLHSQQSPMHVQQTNIPQQSPMHHSPMHPQQSPMHPQQSPLHPQQSPMHQQGNMHPQQSPMHQPSLHQQSQISQQSPMHPQQSPMHSQQSPMHMQQSPMHTQQSPMQSAMSPQHFLQQLQAQRTSPQLPTPSRSPQIYQQSQIQSPVSSHSPQMQTGDYTTSRFSRPAAGCSPLPNRFARPPHHQQVEPNQVLFRTNLSLKLA